MVARELARALRTGLSRVDSDLRRRLPPGWGGAFRAHDVDVVLIEPQRHQRFVGAKPVDVPYTADEAFWLGLERRGHLLASGAVLPLWRRLGIPGFWVNATFVPPRHRRRGLGRLLARSLVDHADRRGWLPLHANVSSTNAQSVLSLQAAGFRIVEMEEWRQKIEAHLGAKGGGKASQIILRSRAELR